MCMCGDKTFEEFPSLSYRAIQKYLVACIFCLSLCRVVHTDNDFQREREIEGGKEDLLRALDLFARLSLAFAETRDSFSVNKKFLIGGNEIFFILLLLHRSKILFDNICKIRARESEARC
jgi:hypothetical protein